MEALRVATGALEHAESQGLAFEQIEELRKAVERAHYAEQVSTKRFATAC